MLTLWRSALAFARQPVSNPPTVLAKLGPLVTAAAGSIRGTTFSRSANGLVVKVKPLPVTRRTPYAAAARQRIASLNTAWLAMSAGDKADWLTFAGTQVFTNKFGDVVAGTAYKAFMRCNAANLYSAAGSQGYGPTLTAPAVTASVLPALPTFTFNTGTRVLEYSSGDANVEADTQLWLFATPPRRPLTRTGVQGYPRVPFLATMRAGDPFPLDITADYEALWTRVPEQGWNEGAVLRVCAHNGTSFWPGITVDLPLEYI